MRDQRSQHRKDSRPPPRPQLRSRTPRVRRAGAGPRTEPCPVPIDPRPYAPCPRAPQRRTHYARGNWSAEFSFEFRVSSNSANETAHLKPETRNSKLSFHRRDALWQIEKAVRRSGPLLEEFPEPDASSPLQQMTYEERLVADFHGTGLTTGPHPMAYRRAEMQALGVHPASSLKSIPSGRKLRIGGCVIARQRPGTAKGFVFLSLEDETGIANAIVHPDLLQKNRILLISGRFLMVEGILQNQDNVISVKAERVLPLNVTNAETSSHDFH